MDRAYSLLELKAVDDDEWVVEGIASTPTPDRYGDIVEPLGAKFALPLPLLWQHDADKPVGQVEFAKPTKSGIPFRARIFKSSRFTSETLKERALEAWESVKTGLVRGVSIGFRSLEHAYMEGGGIHFREWEWLELSLVSIPANSEATIAVIKSIDAEHRAASGRVGRASQPGVSGRKSVRIESTSEKKGTMNIAEQIKDLEATIAAKRAERQAIQEKATKEGRTKDESEREAFETLGQEIDALVKEIADLRQLQAEEAEQAKPVVTAPEVRSASDSRSPKVYVEREEKLDKGIEFARFAMCLTAAKGDVSKALNLAKTHYPKNHRIINVLRAAEQTGSEFSRYAHGMYQRAAVPAGTTGGEDWAAPLVEYNQFAGDFIEFLRPRTIIGRFGTDGIPDLRRIPFNVHIRAQTSGGSANWVGEGKPKPVTSFEFDDVYHGWAKIAAITVLSDELVRFSNPAAEALVRDTLADTIVARMDTDFVDPNNSGSAGVKPKSITNGVPGIPSVGDDGDAVRADIQALWQAAIAANLPATGAVYITTPYIALGLSLLTNPLGQREFPEMTMEGGRLLGRPVIVSNYVPAGNFILAFAPELYLSDDGQVTLDASREAAIEMLDGTLVQDATSGTGTSLVSMFQTNSVALRAERYINWSKRRAAAVNRLIDVNWGGVSVSS